MIITNDEEALRVSCQSVNSDEIGELLDLLDRELANSNRLGRPGIGLSAIQCGAPKKVSIVRLPKIKLNLVNAEIKQGYDLAMFRDEGCLSFPSRVEDTMRYQEVHIINNLVEPYNFIATGLAAVVCQHEIAHYNADLFFDHKMIKPIISATKRIKVGPNDPCLCGKINPMTNQPFKFKKCCGR